MRAEFVSELNSAEESVEKIAESVVGVSRRAFRKIRDSSLRSE